MTEQEPRRRKNSKQKPERSDQESNLNRYYERYKVPSLLRPLFAQWIQTISDGDVLENVIDLRNQLLDQEHRAITREQSQAAKKEAALFILLIQYVAEETDTSFDVLLVKVLSTST